MPLAVFLETLVQDARYALRALRRNPMFAVPAILAVALGIGSTTAVFSVVDRIIFRSLPYPDENRLVSLGMLTPLDSNEFLMAGNYADFRRYQTPFESITSFSAGVAGCDLSADKPLRLGCAQVEGNFLHSLGLAPFLGRNFTAAEDLPNAPRVALITYALWRDRFSADPKLPGTVVSIDGQPVTIIGVLPASFELPTLTAADILMPQRLGDVAPTNTRVLRVFAKLKPGVTISQAHAALEPLFQRALLTVPAPYRKEISLRVSSLRDRQVRGARTASWVLFGSVIAVLLIACANVANLVLARSAKRRNELAVRLALGASRARLGRHALAESMLLSLAGGAAGCALAWALLRLFIGIAPAGLPHLEEASIDGRVLLFALAASIASGLLFGFAPALQNPNREFLTGARAAGARRTFFRESLVAVQIAVSLVLLASAGMLLRSLWKLEAVPLGLDTEHVITADFTLGRQRYADINRQFQFFEQLESRLHAIPGVSAAGISDSLPPSGGMRGRPFAAIHVEGRPPFTESTGGMVAWRFVTPDYFAALGIPIVRGRAFTEDDRRPGDERVILSESLARKLFPLEDPIGKHLVMEFPHTVVGVARDVKNSGPADAPEPEYYVLRKHTVEGTFRRNQAPPEGWRSAKLVLRATSNPKVIADWITRDLHELDPDLPAAIVTMERRVSKLAQRPRFNATLLALFAGMGALLAAIGLYGVMAFLVGQRTQEIGVRMALGATPDDIARLVLSRAALWTAAGAAAGILGVQLAARALRTLLFQVSSHDTLTLAVALLGLVLIAAAAAWLPSRQAARLDPMTALRHE
ncbi:MAG TPA: ABC transporter permease [Bryobacteraceae bacterium]|nr:ABC transporter permease [Bryobacteraceae bacterium]